MNDDFWARNAPSLRKELGLGDSTLAELDAELAQAPKVPLTADEIESIVAYATGKVQRLPPREPRLQRAEFEDIESLESELAAMNRNFGDSDSEVDAEVERLRKEALEEDEREDDDPR